MAVDGGGCGLHGSDEGTAAGVAAVAFVEGDAVDGFCGPDFVGGDGAGGDGGLVLDDDGVHAHA